MLLQVTHQAKSDLC